MLTDFNLICPTCKGPMANNNKFCCLYCYNNQIKEEQLESEQNPIPILDNKIISSELELMFKENKTIEFKELKKRCFDKNIPYVQVDDEIDRLKSIGELVEVRSGYLQEAQ